MELGYGPPGSRAMGTGNFALLHRAYVNKRPRLSKNLQLNFGDNHSIELDDADIEAVAKYYDALPADQDRYEFVYNVMSRGDKFDALLQKLGRKTKTPQQQQQQLDLLERDVKQNSSSNLDRGSVRSAALNTALRLAYAKYPQAQSDVEALIMQDLDVQKNTSQELQSQTKINQRQDDIDVQLRDVARKQSNKIGNLDDENDALSAELDRLSRELDAMHVQTGSEPERRKDSDSDTVKKSDSDTGPSNYGMNVSSDVRAEKSQQRSTDAEKRKSEPEAPPSQQNLASTVPPYIPPPRPTINVIDRPDPSAAMNQIAQQPTTTPAPSQDIPLPTSLKSEPGGPEVDPNQPDLFGEPEDDTKPGQPVPQSMTSMDAEPEPALPPNVYQFPGTKKEPPVDGPDELARHRQTVAQLRGSGAVKAQNAILDPAKSKTLSGMLKESDKQLRRMRELAGLPVNEADSFYVPPKPGVFAIRVDAMFIDDFSPRYRPENPEILWNGLSTAFPQDYPRIKFGTPNSPQADVFAELKNRRVADVKTGLTQDMAETLADRLAKGDSTGQFSRWIQVIQKRS